MWTVGSGMSDMNLNVNVNVDLGFEQDEEEIDSKISQRKSCCEMCLT